MERGRLLALLRKEEKISSWKGILENSNLNKAKVPSSDDN